MPSNSPFPPRGSKASRKICFYDRVKVCYFPSVNTVLKRDLFYNSADYDRFKSDFIGEEVRRMLLEQHLQKSMIVMYNQSLQNQLIQEQGICELDDSVRLWQTTCSLNETERYRQLDTGKTQLKRTELPSLLSSVAHASLNACKRPTKAVAA